MRVLISSETEEDIKYALTYYSSIDREKERRGKGLAKTGDCERFNYLDRVPKDIGFLRMERKRKLCGRCKGRGKMVILTPRI